MIWFLTEVEVDTSILGYRHLVSSLFYLWLNIHCHEVGRKLIILISFLSDSVNRVVSFIG